MAEGLAADGSAGARERLEASLDRVVRRNRFTLAVTVPTVGAASLLAADRGLLPAEVALAPPLVLAAVLAMRLPLVAGVLPAIDRRGTLGLGALALFAYGIEYVGVTTGWPYGPFAYTADFGPAIAGGVPLALPVLYLPLVVDAYLLGLALLGGAGRSGGARVAAGVVALVALDLVLDPGAVAVGFWAYAGGGPYYGVPVSNVAGWVLSGTVAVSILDVALDRAAIARRIATAPYALDDLVSFLVLWGGVNLVVGHWLAVAVAGALAVAVAAAGVVDRGQGASLGSRWPSR